MFKKTQLIAALALLTMAASCGKDEPNEPIVDPVAELSVAPASIDAVAAAGNYSVAVTSNVAWTATAGAEWLTLSPAAGEGNGTVAVNVAENTTVEARTATLTFAAGALTQTVTVAQTGIAATLAVDPEAIEAAATGGNYAITVTSNAPWTAAANADWLTLAPAAGNGNGTVNITATENTTADARTATVTLTAGTLTRTVSVSQDVAPPPHAASTQTWTIGEQIWSDAIQIPDCNKDSFEESLTNPQCRSYTADGNMYYYYNWAYVSQMANDLCPSPWHVPTAQDFVTLDINLGGSGEDRFDMPSWIEESYIDAWGGSRNGSAYSDEIRSMGSAGFYWSATELDDTNAYYLYFSASGLLFVNNTGAYYGGFHVRCVR